MAKTASNVPRLIVGSAFIIDTGSQDGSNILATVSSSTSNTVVVTGVTATLNEYAGRIVTVNSGTGQGQIRTIASNTATSTGNTTITFTANWTVNPPAASIIQLDPPGVRTELGFLDEASVTIKTTDLGIPEAGGGSLSKGVIITAESSLLEVLNLPTFETNFKNKVCWMYFFPAIAGGTTVVCKNFMMNVSSDSTLTAKGKTVAKLIGNETALNITDAVVMN